MELIKANCPFCGVDLRWKLSGRGKHYGGICEEHGFVKIIRNPLLGSEQEHHKSLFQHLKEWFLTL